MRTFDTNISTKSKPYTVQKVAKYLGGKNIGTLYEGKMEMEWKIVDIIYTI